MCNSFVRVSQQVRIHLKAPRKCLAVISESYYPFWHAEVDKQPAEVLRVSCGLIGVALPVGEHEIILRYQPPRTYAVATGISVLALLAALGVVVTSTTRQSGASRHRG